jgi:hypothetical protein
MSGSGVRVWDMSVWEETASLEHARQEFYSVCTPPGGAMVLAAAGDGQVTLALLGCFFEFSKTIYRDGRNFGVFNNIFCFDM